MTAAPISSWQIATITQLMESTLRKTIIEFINNLNTTEELAKVMIDQRNIEFQAAILEEASPIIAEVLKRFLLPSDFIGEEVATQYGYFSGYEPKSIVAQVAILGQLFPELQNKWLENKLFLTAESQQSTLPAHVEGFFVIPHWSIVARNYQGAVKKVLALLESKNEQAFQNYRKDKLDGKYLHETPIKTRLMKTLRDEQGSDILLIPAQFGIYHGGRSARRACAAMNRSEFGLGVFEAGIMLLTHPERLKDENDLAVICSGDEYSLDADGNFDNAPIFDFSEGDLNFTTCWVGQTGPGSGSASGFIFPPGN